MRWLLAGYCGLALINISVALKDFIGVNQMPRFYVMRAKRDVIFQCWTTMEHRMGKVEWYKLEEYNATTKAQLTNGSRIVFHTNRFKNIHFKNKIQLGTLVIHNVQTEDRGVYFCRINGTWGPGTHLQVYRGFNPTNAAYRTKMKDGLMILQAVLLAVFIGAVLLRKRTLQLEKSDSIYEEPETDHIYEGLTIETCGGGLYEELSVYAQAEGTEAPWE